MSMAMHSPATDEYVCLYSYVAFHGNFLPLSRKEANVIEAAASGASNAIPLVANIAANLIAFLAFLAFIDAVLSYLGSMVDHPELSFKVGL